MPRYDFRCHKCGMEAELTFSTYDAMARQEDGLLCPKLRCLGKLERLPALPNFTIRGYSEKNGYSK